MNPTGDPLDRCAELLVASGSFRVLRRLNGRSEYTAGTSLSMATALALDVETTGLTCGTDRIIQFCAIPFDFCKTSGRIFRVHDALTYYEDPGMPVPPEITELTGISDGMVAGQRIDDVTVSRIAAGAALVVAHNAGFDRPFVEERIPAFASISWSCCRIRRSRRRRRH